MYTSLTYTNSVYIIQNISEQICLIKQVLNVLMNHNKLHQLFYIVHYYKRSEHFKHFNFQFSVFLLTKQINNNNNNVLLVESLHINNSKQLIFFSSCRNGYYVSITVHSNFFYLSNTSGLVNLKILYLPSAKFHLYSHAMFAHFYKINNENKKPIVNRNIIPLKLWHFSVYHYSDFSI